LQVNVSIAVLTGRVIVPDDRNERETVGIRQNSLYPINTGIGIRKKKDSNAFAIVYLKLK